MEIFGLILIFAIWFVKAISNAQKGDERKPSASEQSILRRAERYDADRGTSNTNREDEGEKRPVISAANMRRAFENRSAEPESAGVRAEKEQKRRHAAERSQSEKRWADARRQQADSLRVHAAGVDSCEGRLESLRVLYDAGILDREEYAQRVARVKAQHAHE